MTTHDCEAAVRCFNCAEPLCVPHEVNTPECAHGLDLCGSCLWHCRQCRTEPIDDDDARRELRLDEQGRWGG